MVNMEELGDWWADIEGEAINGEQPNFCNSPTWNWQMDCASEASFLDPVPPNPTELNDHTLLEFGVPGDKKAPMEVGHEVKIEERRELSFENISRHFYIPITAAAKELKTGVTQLKKRCRELGIPRWPHRKFKSYLSLSSNVEQLIPEQGESGESKLRRVREIIERERLAMERAPAREMGDETKKLRQACFKAAFKKRRMNGHVAGRKVPGGRSSSSSASPSPAETGASPGSGTA